MNPLLNKTFIELLDKHNQRELYAKIICLNMDELPVEEISGKVSQGTLSIDGSSAIRRTCSLTIVSERVNINEYYWSFTTKFKLYLGLKVPDVIRNAYKETAVARKDQYTDGMFLNGDLIYPYEAYPDIVWFPQGLFLITDFKLQINANGTDNIYITGKDKMALLNGEIGGTFPHSTDLKYQAEFEYDDVTGIPITENKKELTIEEIIREMIHKYANEPLHNIIVKDLTDGRVLLDYKGDNDIYLLKNAQNGLFESVLFDGNVIRYDIHGNKVIIQDIPQAQLDTLSSNYIAKRALKIKSSNNLLDKTYYTVVRCSYGNAVGYRLTKLYYNEENLIADEGSTITQALDKILDMLNDYEYFYDLEGRFVFQKKLTYVNTSWNSLRHADGESNYTNIVRSNLTYDLNTNLGLTESQLQDMTYSESTKLISQVQYSFVGGTTTTAFNNTPNISNIKNDYAIWGKHKNNLTGKDNEFHLRCAIDEKPEKYISFDGTEYSTELWDWRELIYQMALDYLNHNHDDDFEVILYRNNPSYKFGRTGYEQYYEDLVGFWRYLYNPFPPTEEDYNKQVYFSLADAVKAYNEIYITDATDDTLYWNRNVFENPAVLKFWFDFIDGKGSNLDKYSVKAIGDRTKVVNNDDIKAIYYGEVPNLIYITQEDYDELIATNTLNDGFVYVILPENLTEYFEKSPKKKTAQEELDTLMYNYAYCNESISITTIPIYHLEPNVRISVFDEKSKINGEYIINKISVPLNYNGTMSIQATKAPIRIY